MEIKKSHINEKFVEDSDPLKDMGIGQQYYKNLFIEKVIGKKQKDYYYGVSYNFITYMINHDLTTIEVNKNTVTITGAEYSTDTFFSYLKTILRAKPSLISKIKQSKNKLIIIFKEPLEKFVNEKFIKDSDPIKDNIYTKNESMRAITIKEAYGAGYSFTGGGGYRGGMGGTTRGGFGGAWNYGGSNMMYTYEIKPLNHTLEPLPSSGNGYPEIQLGSKIKGNVIRSNAVPDKKQVIGIVHKIEQTIDGAIKYYVVQDEATQTHVKIDPLTVKLIIAEPVEYYDYSEDSLPSRRREKLKTAMKGRKIVRESII